VITGGEALSYRQATEIISNTIGKRLRFVDESRDERARVETGRAIRRPSLKASLPSALTNERAEKH
jgi:hypothetical protein